MWNSRDPKTSCLVAKALRQYASAIQRDLRNYHLDANRSEELDEAIRLTRSMRSATSIVGSFELNRLAALQEELLESIASESRGLDDDALSALMTMLEAIDAYTSRIESQLQQPSPGSPEVRDDLIPAVKAFRRFRGLPEEGDAQAISTLFSTSPAFGQAGGPHSLDEAGDDETPSQQPRPAGGAVNPSQSVISADALASDYSRQREVPPELWDIFCEEANDHIERIYGALRKLEKDTGDREVIQEIRRSAHTLKGSAAAIGLQVVSQLSHRAEDLLDALYAGSVQLNSECLNLLATTADMLYDMFSSEGENWNEENLRALYSAFDTYCGTAQGPSGDEAAGADRAPPASDVPPQNSKGFEQNGNAAAAITKDPRPATYVRVPTDRVEALRRIVSESIVNRAAIEQELAGFNCCAAALKPVLGMLRSVCSEMEHHRKTDLCRTPQPISPSVTLVGQPLMNLNRDREEFDELEFDRFTNLDLWSQSLAEATTTIGNVEHDLRSRLDDCDTLLAQQSRLVLEAQDRLFRIQMVPVATIMPRLHRAVREVATREDKSVELLVDGEDVELDKTVLETMVEPLLHMLRNAVDHGIEPANERTGKGKPAEAVVQISVSHFGTQVVIRVSDDGRGLDAEKIRAKAVQGGDLSEEEANCLTPQQLHRHIFLPGFSTAAKISEVSGRGVGMDVVRAKIEELKGRIDVDSLRDRGTSFTIRLPVSLAVTRALMLVAADEQFAIPQKAVQSINQVALKSTDLGDTQRICIDDQEYPLVNLRSYLGLDTTVDPSSDSVLIAMIGSGSQQVALQVDGVLPGRDIVVKPVGNPFAIASGLLGATILGDGTVVPILDPTDLIASNDAVDQLASLASASDRSEAAPPATIMIVEDSVSMRHVLQNVIEQEGWRAVTARDGVDALETLATLELPPDVFLLDVEMPRMDGYDLLRTLRQEEVFAETPIIMITSRSGDKHRQQAISLGATAYLTKPFQDDALIETVHQHLD